MTTHPVTSLPPASGAYADQVAAQVRAHLGRLGLTKHDLAVRLGQNDVWIGRRISAGVRRVPLDLNDLASIAQVLDLPITDLLPRVDSNHQPAGYTGGDAALDLDLEQLEVDEQTIDRLEQIRELHLGARPMIRPQHLAA